MDDHVLLLLTSLELLFKPALLKRINLQIHKAVLRNHSHTKRKDSLETRTVLLIFLLELEMSRVAAQVAHQNSEKW